MLLLAAGSGPARAAAPQTYAFTIEGQSAQQALTEFARQADTTLLFDYDVIANITTNRLQGEYTLQEGLQALLAGTELAVQVDASGRLSVRHKDYLRQASAPASSPEAASETSMEFGLERIAVVGSRNAPRSVVSSNVPLDIISASAFNAQGGTDLVSMLATAIPSLNVNDQPINDATSLVRPANLRGMASDHTLLLLNGKRRHRSAVITFLGGGLSDGAQGPDISVLPATALQQVEVLRDGAAAQYGSDAIAGVINFVLKDASEGGMLAVKTGQFSAGDGQMVQLQGNLGLPLSSQGFANFTVEYRQQQPTSRSVQRSDAQALRDAGNLAVPEPAQVWGTLKVNHDVKAAANLGYRFSDQHAWYGFATLAQRDINGGFYYRNPHGREGVFVQADDRSALLVADLDGLNQGIACPQVTITSGNVLSQPDYALIADNSTAVGRNCFAYNEWYAGGFTPRFGGVINDGSVFSGFEGQLDSGWQYDISAGLGYSHIDYSLVNTVNPSLGPASPQQFSPGGVKQVERTANLDFSRPFSWPLTQAPLQVNVGAEWRSETYHQQAGDVASWQAGPLAAQGFSVGSNGFPGYQPAAAGHWSRSNYAVYSDVLLQAERYSAGMAVRHERFTDFGTTFDGKISARYALSPALAVRGSLSTGFKAPTVGQANVINVTTAFAANGLEDQATLPPTHPISVQLGAQLLQPEESVNRSLGLVATWGDTAYVTLDYFNIDLRNRISTTSAIPLSEADIQALARIGQTDASRYAAAKFFANDFDTRTQGVDLVAHWSLAQGALLHDVDLAINWTDTQVERISLYPVAGEDGQVNLKPNLTASRMRMLEDNLPAVRGTLTTRHHWQNVSLLWRANYYGSFYEDHLDASAGLDIGGEDMVTLDAELSWMLSERWTLAAGAVNLTDERPSLNPYRERVGALYPPTSPAGINGAFFYAQAQWQF